jgi:hypothetical protein
MPFVISWLAPAGPVAGAVAVSAPSSSRWSHVVTAELPADRCNRTTSSAVATCAGGVTGRRTDGAAATPAAADDVLLDFATWVCARTATPA